MRNLYLWLRRLAGFFGLVFGDRRTREARRQLRKLDTAPYANRMVSDAVLMNDIPSPSVDETLRMDFVRRRLAEFGISNTFTDQWGNVLAVFPAFGTRRDFVLLAAEVGDADYSPLENAVRLSRDRATGQGLGEHSLGAAALLVLAEFAHNTGFHLGKNLLILFTRSSAVDEREEAFRHFLDTWADRLTCAVVVAGTGLGVVGTRHRGAYRLSLTVRNDGAAAILGGIAERIGAIVSDDPASVGIARMEAGRGFGHRTVQGEMDVEIVAEDDKALESLKTQVTRAVEGAADGAKITIDTLVRLRRSAGDPGRNAPLVAVHRRALAEVLVDPEPGFVTDKVAMLNERGVPALEVGVTRGNERSIELAPLAAGFRQLLLVVEGCSQVTEEER